MDDQFVRVETSDLSLVFWPARGGRLMSVHAHGTEFLWRNPELIDSDWEFVSAVEAWRVPDGSMGSWMNVGGSKTWPAPQGWSGAGEWPGPPDDRLDSGCWSLKRDLDPISGETLLRMDSPADNRTGLRVSREFWIPPQGTHFRQRNTFTNISEAPVRWSIWEVCQVDTEDGRGGELRVGSATPLAPTQLLQVVGIPSSPTWDGEDLILPVEDVVTKLGFSQAERHVSLHRPDGRSLSLQFTPDEEATYPDSGSRAELWMQYPLPSPLPEFGGLHPRAHLVELEVLGPLVELEPGGSSVQEIRWVANGGGTSNTVSGLSR